jgi:uncharacterized protein
MPPRLLPGEPFPAYAFVPGRFPHPVSDPRGHSHGQQVLAVEALDPQEWQRSRAYLRALDLFNHGYYWEAHEFWEALWHACGRQGVTAEFLKGLIRLAAAGVKVRERRPAGVSSHGNAAENFLKRVAEALGPETARYGGLSLAELQDAARQVAVVAVAEAREELPAVEVVFPFVLCPSPWPGE